MSHKIYGQNVLVINGSTPESSGEYTVRVIDYDGTIIMTQKGNNGDVITLPDPQMHDNLIFQEWSASDIITNNTVTINNSNIDIGAIYTTASGLNEFDITLNSITGLEVTLNLDGTKDWGDGSSDTETTHTYSDYGSYTITCDGTTMTTSSTSNLFGQGGTSNPNYYLTDVRLATIKNISIYAFYWCYSLLTVIISNSVIDISEMSFYYCKSLLNIILPKGIILLNRSTFGSCMSLMNIIIPHRVGSIGNTCFSGCKSLTSIVIPNNVTEFASKVFSNCQALTDICFSNITTVGGSAFDHCYNLTNIYYGGDISTWCNISGLSYLVSNYKHIFIQGKEIKGKIIPNTNSIISGNAFAKNTEITDVIIQDGVKTIGNYAFYNCTELINANIPDSVTSIGTYAFGGCNNLISVNIPVGIDKIDQGMFSGCSKLTSIVIPNNITKIISYAFKECFNLINVVVGSNVVTISDNVFNNCHNVRKYDFSSHTAVPTLSNANAFTGINALCKIIVPDSLYDEWIAATNWSTYANYIYKASEVTE